MFEFLQSKQHFISSLCSSLVSLYMSPKLNFDSLGEMLYWQQCKQSVHSCIILFQWFMNINHNCHLLTFVLVFGIGTKQKEYMARDLNSSFFLSEICTFFMPRDPDDVHGCHPLAWTLIVAKTRHAVSLKRNLSESVLETISLICHDRILSIRKAFTHSDAILHCLHKIKAWSISRPPKAIPTTHVLGRQDLARPINSMCAFDFHEYLLIHIGQSLLDSLS